MKALEGPHIIFTQGELSFLAPPENRVIVRLGSRRMPHIAVLYEHKVLRIVSNLHVYGILVHLPESIISELKSNKLTCYILAKHFGCRFGT